MSTFEFRPMAILLGDSPPAPVEQAQPTTPVTAPAPANSAVANGEETGRETLSATVRIIDLTGKRPYGRMYLPPVVAQSSEGKQWVAKQYGMLWPNGTWTAFSEPYGPAAESLPAGHRRAPYKPVPELAGEATAVHGCITTHPVSGIEVLWGLVMKGDTVLAILNALPRDAARVLKPLGIDHLRDGNPFWSVQVD